MTDWFARPLLDLGSVDLDAAGGVEYLLCQRFRYEYDVPAYDVRQRLVAVPRRRHGSLHVRAHNVSVDVCGTAEWSLGGEAAPAERAPARRAAIGCGGAASTVWRSRVDRLGNMVVDVHVAEVHCTVEFTVAAVVHRDGPLVDTALPAASLRHQAHLRPTALTRPDDALRAVAAEVRASTAGDVEFAEVACSVVRAGIEYGFGATSVETTAAEAWAIGRGVCQDSAHVLLALCRAAGVPARYVSGHLLGQLGGSHAWVEVLVADGAEARALGVDPSNGCRAGPRHLPVAVGRDYTDVAPTSGSYRGEASGRLTSTKHAGVTAVVENLLADVAI